MNLNALEKEATIESMIREGKGVDIAVHKTTIYYEANNVLIPIDNIIRKHLPYIKENCIDVHLSEEEYIKYQYNPYKLSYDLYGTVELWFLILALNDTISPTKFNKRKLVLLKKSDLKIINDICIIFDEKIKRNKREGYKG